MKENGFRLKKTRNRRYSTETITDTDYAVHSASCKYTNSSQIPAS